MAECLLPKSERLSAVGSRAAVPPNRLSYTLQFPATVQVYPEPLAKALWRSTWLPYDRAESDPSGGRKMISAPIIAIACGDVLLRAYP